MSSGPGLQALRRLFDAIIDAAERDPALMVRLGAALRARDDSADPPGAVSAAPPSCTPLASTSPASTAPTPATPSPEARSCDSLVDCAAVYAAEGAAGLARRLRGFTKRQLLAIARSDPATPQRGLAGLSAPELVYRIVAAHDAPPDLVGRDFA